MITINFIENQLNSISDLIKKIKYEDCNKLYELINKSSQVILIGNGGSNSIASNVAADYTKFLRKKSLAFTDASMLTAYINDYGTDNGYQQFISDMILHNGLVILISSSGNSQNIYNCAEYCKNNNINFIILTGSNKDNLINKNFFEYAELSYWVDSKSNPIIESLHQIFLHSIIDN